MGNSAKILVIDDDDQIRKTITAILREEGYVTDEARSGAEAIAKSQSDFYNLALVDLKLPDMEGTDLLPLLKETVPKMRKIMVTGFPSQQNAIAALNAGADAFLVKPVDIEKFLAVIADQLGKQEAEKTFSEERMVEFIQTRIKTLES
jgi:DNA-binding response OmpR family regulator